MSGPDIEPTGAKRSSSPEHATLADPQARRGSGSGHASSILPIVLRGCYAKPGTDIGCRCRGCLLYTSDAADDM
eukprot:337932-Rhodomonas_salina.3